MILYFSSYHDLLCNTIFVFQVTFSIHIRWPKAKLSDDLFPAFFYRLTWPCLVGRCCQDLFNIALNILAWLPSSFFSTVTYHLSRKLSKLDEPNMPDTAGEASSYVMIRDVTLKTCQRRRIIGRRRERGSGISVLAARHDDDDDEHDPVISVCS